MDITRSLNFDSGTESMGRIFVVATGCAVGAILTLLILPRLTTSPQVSAYLESDTAFRVVILLWAAVVPSYLAARQERPYLLIVSLIFALLGLDAGPVILGPFVLLIAATYYLARPKQPAYRVKAKPRRR